MSAALRMRQYQQQAIRTASPEQLVVKIYDLGVAACHRQDRAKVRAVLVELMAGLNFEQGGDIAERLRDLYEYCLLESTAGDLDVVCTILSGLRDTWREAVLHRRAA